MNGDGEPKFGYGKDRRGREPYLACERGGTEEDPGHVNGVLKAIAVALTLTLPVAGCTGSEPRPEPAATAWQSIEIDHHSGPAPQPLSGAGPAPGVLREQWRIEDVRAAGALAGSQLAFHLIGGSLLVATGDGVVSYDAGSGAQVWQYREPGRRVFAGVTAGTVVIASQEPDKAIGSGAEGDERLAGLNAATGELLWQRHNQWRVGTYVSLLTVADGFVPAAEAGQHDTPELSGIDARTGEVGWVTSYDDCGSAILDPPRSSDGSLLLLQRHCKGENVVEAYHPATGEQLWTRSWPATGPLPEASAREGTAMVQTGSRLEVIQADGETSTLEVDPASNDPIHFYLPVEKEHSSSLVDVRTGETVSEGWPKYLSVHAPTLDDDDTLYALEGPHPVPTLMMGQADGGDLTWMPFSTPATSHP